MRLSQQRRLWGVSARLGCMASRFSGQRQWRRA